jgi:uncharacterized protein YqeY
MGLRTDLEEGLKDALRSGDELRKRTLRMALSAIKFAEVEKRVTLDDAAMTAILQKEIKSRQESLAEAQRFNRPDLEAAARDEIAVLEAYLPKQLGAEELDSLAQQAIADVGATTIREMGQVMKVLIPRLQGRASGDQASQAVRRLLQ